MKNKQSMGRIAAVLLAAGIALTGCKGGSKTEETENKQTETETKAAETEAATEAITAAAETEEVLEAVNEEAQALEAVTEEETEAIEAVTEEETEALEAVAETEETEAVEEITEAATETESKAETETETKAGTVETDAKAVAVAAATETETETETKAETETETVVETQAETEEVLEAIAEEETEETEDLEEDTDEEIDEETEEETDEELEETEETEDFEDFEEDTDIEYDTEMTVVIETEVTTAPETETEEDEYVDKNKSLLTRRKLTFDGQQYVYRRGITNYLIIGTDNSDLALRNTENKQSGYVCKMADMLLLLSVDEQDQSYTILQLDRNTLTDIQMLYTSGDILDTKEMQLCAAYYYGHDEESACENTIDAVSNLLHNTPIKGYVAVGMDSIDEINAIAGGVKVTLKDDFSEQDPEMVEGAELTLTNEQAKVFVTSRTNMENDSNEARLRRQRTYMDGLLAAIKANVKEDPNYVDEAFDQLSDLIVTNEQEKELAKLAAILEEYDDCGVVTLDGYTSMGVALGDDIDHEEFNADPEGLAQTVIDLFYEEEK